MWRFPLGCYTLLLAGGALLGAPRIAHAKTVSGDFRLSVDDTEHVLTSFSVVPTGGALLRLNLTASDMYEDERLLAVYLYRDTEWPKFKSTHMCNHKIRLSQQRQALTFDYTQNEWRSDALSIVLVNTKETSGGRAHYWYVVVTDCLLEQTTRAGKAVPRMHYQLEILNQLSPDVLTHFSADELGLYRYHGVTLLVTGLVALGLVFKIGQQMTSSSISSNTASLHVTLLWACLAASLGAASAFLELVHLRIYESNGIGSYFLDALAAHAEALADALCALLLWCLAAGWTLSSDVQERALHRTNAVAISGLFRDWRRPFGFLTGQGWGPGHVLMLLWLVAHIVLAQWGRIYNDNFDSYHDYEHGPGRILMLLRCLGGALFAVACQTTRYGLQQHATGRDLQTFYGQLFVCGLLWYGGLPFLTWGLAAALPYYLRNGVVVVGASLLQAAMLAALAYLVTSSPALAKVQEKKASGAAESLGSAASTTAPSLFSFGKTKIRLD
jgi:hypothetical protein